MVKKASSKSVWCNSVWLCCWSESAMRERSVSCTKTLSHKHTHNTHAHKMMYTTLPPPFPYSVFSIQSQRSMRSAPPLSHSLTLCMHTSYILFFFLQYSLQCKRALCIKLVEVEAHPYKSERFSSALSHFCTSILLSLSLSLSLLHTLFS